MYRQFNTLIHDHFFKKESTGDNIILSVDNELIKDIAKRMNISSEKLLSSLKNYLENDWEKTLVEVDGIPQYFGLIAVQVFAACLMQEEERYTENAYLIQLNKLLGYEGNYRIYNLFKRHQDEIWKKLKEWVKERGFKINIPEPKEESFRYVQYPLSQALLNIKDFTQVPLLFQETEIKPGEDFSLEDFTIAVFSAPCGILTPHFNRVYEKYPEDVQRQIFNFYKEWDGSIPETVKKDKTISSPHYENNADNLVLERRLYIDKEDQFDLYITDGNSSRKAEFSWENSDLFSEIRKFYKLSHNNIILFVQDVDYKDWVETRFLQYNISCIVLIKKANPEGVALVDQLKKIAKNDYSSGLYYLFELLIKDPSDIPESIKKIFSKSKNRFTVQNGLKLGRKIWMVSAGPDIIFEGENIRWWLDGERKEDQRFSCRNLPLGEHTIKIPDNTPVKFFIEAPKEEMIDLDKGWKVSSNPALWENTSKNLNIKGLILETVEEINDVPIIRQWAEAVMNTGEKGQNLSLPVLINTIRRKHNGIRR